MFLVGYVGAPSGGTRYRLLTALPPFSGRARKPQDRFAEHFRGVMVREFQGCAFSDRGFR